MRAGSRALELLTVPLIGRVLQRLSDGPKRLVELQVETGPVPQTTLRTHLRGLEEIGAVVKRGREDSPGVVEFALGEPGEDLLEVVAAVERWLQLMPREPLSFGGDAGKAALKALLGGWSSTILRTLAGNPRSLSELAGAIRMVSYPAIERRLGALRLNGLVEAREGDGRGTPYAVTDWLRQSVAPLAAAVHWEQQHLADDCVGIARVDAETIFLLALPALRTPSSLTGSCLMGMTLNGGGDRDLAAVVAHVQKGKVSCSAENDERTDAWAKGEPPAWIRAMIGLERDHLDVGGHRRLARALVDGLGPKLLTFASA
ncbi:MAG TPA: winged helix-turn-helix transcriptional regulator [Solirubrobacterales bacterium]|nr:winged helix-turn-helix transcriptional regulator [Solirubrobacterales bacterium]